MNRSIMKGRACIIYAGTGLILLALVLLVSSQLWLMQVTQLGGGAYKAALRLMTVQQSTEDLGDLRLQVQSLTSQMGNQSVQMQSLRDQIRSVAAQLLGSVRFLPLKDPAMQRPQDEPDRTWFMASLRQRTEEQREAEAEHFYFPSAKSENRLLCVAGRHRSNGSANSYGFAVPDFLPDNATLLPGLTFVADQYYDYGNPWHGLTTLIPVLSWRLRNRCEAPDRLLLYHKGELVVSMGAWIAVVLAASLDRAGVAAEPLAEAEKGPVCFERAVVYRRGFGRMPLRQRLQLFDTVRCKVRRFCNVTRPPRTGSASGSASVNVTLVARTGSRAFRNESAVAEIMEKECRKLSGCNFRLVHIANLTFCQQVQVMTETDVLATVHGAQLTNMMFMDRNSSVMEMFPKGWLEGAGVGQYVFHWFASWCGMIHEGTYRDTHSPECPNHNNHQSCFEFYKDRPVDHNATLLSLWTFHVLHSFLNRTAIIDSASTGVDASCACDSSS